MTSSTTPKTLSIFGVCQSLLSQGATDIFISVESFGYGTDVQYELSIKGKANNEILDGEVVCPRPCQLFAQ